MAVERSRRSGERSPGSGKRDDRAPRRAFLPTTIEDVRERGYDQLDVIIVTGDAYVDHPAFGPVVIARLLEAEGFRVGLVAQPSWTGPEDIARLGRPRLFVGIGAGNLDSMLNRLTAQKKLRSTDPYSPGGRPGLRPNRATIVYANLCRQAFPGLPIVIGGIEASLRRLVHYDYWADQVRRSILLDAKADLLVYGMGERATLEIARRLRDRRGPNGGDREGPGGVGGVGGLGGLRDLCDVPGTCHALNHPREWSGLAEKTGKDVVLLPSFEEVVADKAAFATMTRLFEKENTPFCGRPLLQPHGEQAVYHNPPALPLEPSALDRVYDLPYTRTPHPDYKERIPAFDTVRHSVTALRGCYGGCAFCSLAAHEGRTVQSRSREGVLRDIRRLADRSDFAGTVADLGGPSANMYGTGCRKPDAQRLCKRPSCLHPAVCKNLSTDPNEGIALLRAARAIPNVRHVFIASGVRHDLAELHPAYVREIVRHHVGGQLSVAPEHVVGHVLSRMRKPPIDSYDRFAEAFEAESRLIHKEQFLVPYFITGHPGSTLRDAVELAIWLKRRGIRPRQVQDFIPTPMSNATAMYWTGIDPASGDAVHVTRSLREKRMMKALALYWDEAQWPLVREALHEAKRVDLIGMGPQYLVPAPKGPRTKGRGR